MASATTATLVGRECTGKSALAAALTGRRGRSLNVRGSTVSCDTYAGRGLEITDTPGILLSPDTDTTRRALAALTRADTVLVVAQAPRADEDLADLLPLVRHTRAAIVLTFWDKVRRHPGAAAGVARLRQRTGLPVVTVDARALDPHDRAAVGAAIQASALPLTTVAPRMPWRAAPAPTLLERRWTGPLISTLLLLVPAWLTIWAANTLAGLADPLVQALTGPVAAAAARLPAPFPALLAGRFGLLTMGPLLFVWAVPAVVLHALLVGGYKASGLLDRLTAAMHPIVRPFGLTGRDLMRVVMGFGCNVPAVVATRSCSDCSRPSTIAVIAFGAACSYQMGATLAVFSAARLPWLVGPYLALLAGTTLVYARLTSPAIMRSRSTLLVIEDRVFLTWPSAPAIWQDAASAIAGFFRQAFPTFLVITVIASLVDGLGLLDRLSRGIAPAMAIVALPAETALPVVLASIRKDGILLLAAPDLSPALTPIQLLTAVYLAGVLLPCLVTTWTIARERTWPFAGRLVARQAAFAVGCACAIAWIGRLFPL